MAHERHARKRVSYFQPPPLKPHEGVCKRDCSPPPYAEVDNPREDVHHSTLYIVSLYWSVMTATTIGYGDIVLTTDIERLMSTMCMLIGG